MRPCGLTSPGAHRASHGAAAPAGCRWRPAPLRTPPPRADHALPPGAAARRQLHRPHRGQHRRRVAPVHQGRVRRLPGMRHPGPRLPEASVRRVRPRQAAGVQLQAARVLPLMRCAEDVADGGAPGRPRHPARAGAAMGAVAADPAARAAGRAARAGHAGAAGGAACETRQLLDDAKSGAAQSASTKPGEVHSPQFPG